MKKPKFEFYNAQFEVKIPDLWVGAFWKRTGRTVDLWICFLPCLPLHISWGWKDADQ